MIKSELGRVTLTRPTPSKEVNKAILYADFASILNAITDKYGLSTTLEYLETYTNELKENMQNDSRNEI